MSEIVPEYEGKAKQMLPGADASSMVQRFKDSATAFNGVKKEEFPGKGRLNNAISTHIFQALEEAGVRTHFIERTSERDMVVKRLKMIPLEVVVRNVVTGSLAKRTGLVEGTAVNPPIVETYFKNDALGDPILADCHVLMMNLVTEAQLAELKELALRVNTVLSEVLEAAQLRLVDFKLEFGFDPDGRILLGDEVSPDTCRIWDNDGRKLDKDVFRQDLAGLVETYEEVARRLNVNV
ncbi:MAG: phosphoribosylaminoimidazolesuccinocarboxamide synthase [bacterium]